MSRHSLNLERVLKSAMDFAEQFHHQQTGPNHILLAILKMPESQAYQLLEDLRVPIERIRDHITFNRFVHEPYGAATRTFNARSKGCLDQSAQIARQTGSAQVRTEHLLLGLLLDSATVREVFKPVGVQVEALIPKLLSRYGLQTELAGPRESPAPGKEFEVLCPSLNELARQGKLDPVIGRQPEIRRTLQILGRRRKNNPVLIGEAGVGKTAIVEGIAVSIVQNARPPALRDKKIHLLEVAGLVSNTLFRGQLEARVKMVLDHVRDHPEILLFIDEIHLLVGAGSSVGGMDVSNMMKAALSRGEVRVIGATTEDEYHKTIAADPALERRFQPVRVDEPPEADVLRIVAGTAKLYEAHHGVSYLPAAITTALALGRRYLAARRFPDKVLDILDEAGSALNLANDVPRDEPPERTGTSGDGRVPRICTEDHIRSTVSLMCGVPLGRLNAGDKQAVRNLEADLSAQIIGQPKAIHATARYLRRSRAQLNDPRRPLGAIMYLGPSGVGKSLLARRVAENMCGTEAGLIQLDMSEYMEKHSVSRLIGSPPGYEDRGNQRTLVELVRRQPYSVVLFDEIEKAHPDVLNALLQMLQEGRMTDGRGRTASFRNCLILMTSNVGWEQFRRNGIGFKQDATAVEDAVRSEVRRAFRPEFLNRLDEIILFERLSPGACRQIIELELADILGRTRYEDLQVSGDLRERLLQEGFSEEYGGRPLKRAMERLITDSISDAVIQDRISETGKLLLEWRDGAVTVHQLMHTPSARAERTPECGMVASAHGQGQP